MSNPPTSHRFDLPAIVFAISLPTVVTLVYFVLLAKAPAAFQQAAYGTISRPNKTARGG